MGQRTASASERPETRGKVGGLWALTLPILLFANGAAIFGIGCWQLSQTANHWEALSNLLLGAALAVMGIATRRQALGARLGLTPRLLVVGMMLAAVAIHFLLV